MSPALRPRRLSIFWKLAIAFGGFAILPVLVASLLTLFVARGAVLDLADRSVAAEVDLATDLVESLLSRTADDMRLLADSVRIADGELSEALRTEFMLVARRHPAYRQVRWIDETGRERVRVNQRHGGPPTHAGALQDKSNRYYVREGLAMPSGALLLSPVDLNREHGVVEDPPRYVFRVTLAFGSDRGEQLGLIVINIEAEEILAALRVSRGSAGSRAWILGQDGVYLEESGPAGEPLVVAGSTAPWQAELPGRTTAAPAVLRSEGRIVGAGRLHLPPGWQGDPWTLAISRSEDALLGGVAYLPAWQLALAASLFLLSLLVAFVAARSLSAPLLRLGGVSRALAQGEFDPDFRVETGDEVEALADALRDAGIALAQARVDLEAANESLAAELEVRMGEIEVLHGERMEAERKLLRADRLASVGLMSASIAHEIGNPLAGMKTNLQVAERALPDDARARRPIERTAREVDRLTGILRKWTGFAGERSTPGSASAREVLDTVWELLRMRAARRGIELEISGDALDRPLSLDRGTTEQIALNLLLNAIQAQGKPGVLRVDASREPDAVILRFDDEGPGIPEEARRRVFEPFETTKPDGTGLGLAIVRRLVEAAGGEVTLGDAPSGGARVTLRLPVGRGTRVRASGGNA